MDESLRPIESEPIVPATRFDPQRRKNEDQTFDLNDAQEKEPGDDEAAPEQDPHSLDRHVAPRAEDEAGGNLDVTA